MLQCRDRGSSVWVLPQFFAVVSTALVSVLNLMFLAVLLVGPVGCRASKHAGPTPSESSGMLPQEPSLQTFFSNGESGSRPPLLPSLGVRLPVHLPGPSEGRVFGPLLPLGAAQPTDAFSGAANADR
ncbi:MAG: hypothetical protein ACOC0P_02855 [Planctomycetota bacterium]